MENLSSKRLEVLINAYKMRMKYSINFLFTLTVTTCETKQGGNVESIAEQAVESSVSNTKKYEIIQKNFIKVERYKKS